MEISSEVDSLYIMRRTVLNKILSRELITSAQRVMGRGTELCQAVHERRRRPDFFNHLAKYAKTFPRMRRYLPLTGGEGDSLRIETEERPEGMVAHVTGEVDLANVARFKAALQPALSNCRNVILDITNLRYIDSTGLHVLIDANEALQVHKCQLIVAGASPGISKVMHILQVDEMMLAVSTVDEAIEFLRPGSSEAASNG